LSTPRETEKPTANERDAVKRQETDDTEESKVITPVDARQGKKLGAMRYVLGISLALAVAAMVIIYIV